MDKTREIDTRESIKTITTNDFITACGLENISLKARKLLYIAISQCKKNDAEFYEYAISVSDFAKLMGIDESNIYKEADKLTDELMKGFIRVKPEGKKRFHKYQLFDTCEYNEDSTIRFELSEKMTNFFLKLNKNFTKPLLSDFVKMNSPYSMAIWHLMQREMQSKKPDMTETFTFYLSLEELREVTGTQNKLKQVGQFKERVLDKAIREIKDNCGVNITYTNSKKGRTIIGFRFSAVNIFHISEDKIPQKIKDKCELFNANSKK
jgi:plasmid replication initiation protein